MQICLCIMCGLPGSGKTTFCNRLSHTLGAQYRIVNINYDSLLLSSSTENLQLHHSLCTSSDKEVASVFKSARRELLSLVEMVVWNLTSHGWRDDPQNFEGWNVIDEEIRKCFVKSWLSDSSRTDADTSCVVFLVDDNMHLPSMRHTYYQLARQYRTGFCEVFLDVSLDQAVERNAGRQGRSCVSRQVIENMQLKMQPPDPEKNSWEMFSVRLSDDFHLERVVSLIKTSLDKPVFPRETTDPKQIAVSRASCAKSLHHQADLILRRCVSSAMAAGKQEGCDVRAQSHRVNQVKKELLDLIRTGAISFESSESSFIENASKDDSSFLYRYIVSLFSERLKQT